MANGRFIAYYRVSTAQQGASGLGLEAQQLAVEAYLNGGAWELVEAYTDVESGTRKGNSRPELVKAIAHARRIRATLVIAKVDRLARNVAFISSIMESAVDFVAVDMPQANRLTLHILAAVAEAEAEAISKRTKEALAAAKARGTRLGNPQGFTPLAQVQGPLAARRKAVDEYARVTGLIFDLRGKGMSFAKIAAHLNARGELTRQGQVFQAMTVKRICDRASNSVT